MQAALEQALTPYRSLRASVSCLRPKSRQGTLLCQTRNTALSQLSAVTSAPLTLNRDCICRWVTTRPETILRRRHPQRARAIGPQEPRHDPNLSARQHREPPGGLRKDAPAGTLRCTSQWSTGTACCLAAATIRGTLRVPLSLPLPDHPRKLQQNGDRQHQYKCNYGKVQPVRSFDACYVDLKPMGTFHR